jgi:hypothetical protein
MPRQVFVFLFLTIPALGFGATTLFKSPQDYRSGGANAISVAVADLNGDGKPDIVVANGCIACQTGAVFGVGVLLGNGDGTFQTAHNYPVGDRVPISVAVGDVNGDGKPDLVVTSCFLFLNCESSGGVSVLLGNGDGSFQPAVTYSSGGMGVRGIALADLNRDGNLDLIVTNCAPYGSASCYFGSEGNIAVFLGKGDGTFQAPKTFGSGGVYPWSLAVADVNGDGELDVVVLNCADSGRCESSNAGVGVLLGKGDGTFLPVAHYGLLDAAAGGISVADVNGDGNPDIEVANGHVGVLLGNGDGTFQAERTYTAGGSFPNAVAVADVNRDGKADLVVANYLCSSNCNHGSVGVLLGNGDGTFQHALTYGSGGYGAFGLTIVDLNADFKPDVVVANNCGTGFDCSTGVIGVLLGTVGFQTSTNFQSSLNPSEYGQTITFTASVTSSGPTVLTGQVAFRWTLDGQTFEIGRATLNGSGVATLSKANLNADTYPLMAVYLGDVTHQSSTSAILNQVVKQTVTSTRIGSSLNPSSAGQAVTFTATVSSPTVKPSGPVTFLAGKAALGTAQLNWAGKASFTTSILPVGSTVVTAIYYGNSNIAKSSASVTQTVR